MDIHIHIPRDFPKWDKKVDGLEDAGKWALESERSRLPADLVVPRTGQIWETIRDCTVNYRAQINLPWPQPNQVFGVANAIGRIEPAYIEAYMMQFGTIVLRRGERVRVLQLWEPKPIDVCFVPVRYDELHESIIPVKVRNLSTYHGAYELRVKIARTVSDFQEGARHNYFNEEFHLIEDVA